MNSIKIAALTGLVTAISSASMAADLSRVLLPPAPVIRDIRSSSDGWYLRGDVGYAHPKRPEADFAVGPFTGGFARESLGDSAVAGVGLGYRFNANFRADVTADYINARFRGIVPTSAFAAASVTDRGRFQSATVLVNGYLDFGTFRGFTPYVGAGIGVARNVLSDYTRTSYDAAGTETWERLAGGGDYSLAWALMAGVGYRLSRNFTLDLGYRYVGRGDLTTRTYAAGAGADVDSIGTHEVRLGVRYGFH